MRKRGRVTKTAVADDFHPVLKAYAKHAATVLAGKTTSSERLAGNPNKVAYLNPAYQLRSLVDEIENSPQFTELCGGPAGTREPIAEIWKNLFRRSGFYLKSFNGKRPSAEKLYALIGTPRKKFRATRLTILDDVGFASKAIDFGIFKIQRFTKNELDILTERVINEIFYPFARIDTEWLSRFCFIVEDLSKDVGDPEKESSIEYDEWLEIKPEMPVVLLQLLGLHPWRAELTEQEVENYFGGDRWLLDRIWSGPTVGQSFVLNHIWTLEPQRLPELKQPKRLSELPVYIDAIHTAWVCKSQEAQIRTIVEKGQKLLRIVELVKPNWDFVEIAMGYIGKAFLAKPDLEQLLWNVTVLDCLLSDKEAVTQGMRRRIGNILGSTDQERKQVRRHFDEIYDFRSDLVHGNTFRKKAQFDHLANARNLAREVMSWFVDYLLWVDNDFRQREIDYQHYPRRNELLYVLDFDKPSLNRLNRFIGRLPANFPKF